MQVAARALVRRRPPRRVDEPLARGHEAVAVAVERARRRGVRGPDAARRVLERLPALLGAGPLVGGAEGRARFLRGGASRFGAGLRAFGGGGAGAASSSDDSARAWRGLARLGGGARGGGRLAASDSTRTRRPGASAWACARAAFWARAARAGATAATGACARAAPPRRRRRRRTRTRRRRRARGGGGGAPELWRRRPPPPESRGSAKARDDRGGGAPRPSQGLLLRPAGPRPARNRRRRRPHRRCSQAAAARAAPPRRGRRASSPRGCDAARRRRRRRRRRVVVRGQAEGRRARRVARRRRLGQGRRRRLERLEVALEMYQDRGLVELRRVASDFRCGRALAAFQKRHRDDEGRRPLADHERAVEEGLGPGALARRADDPDRRRFERGPLDARDGRRRAAPDRTDGRVRLGLVRRAAEGHGAAGEAVA